MSILHDEIKELNQQLIVLELLMHSLENKDSPFFVKKYNEFAAKHEEIETQYNKLIQQSRNKK